MTCQMLERKLKRRNDICIKAYMYILYMHALRYSLQACGNNGSIDFIVSHYLD